MDDIDAFSAGKPAAPIAPGSITIYRDVEQGSDEWFALRCGKLTASEMKLIITPTLKAASNDKERQHLYELAAQRVTNYVEPTYVSDDMLRGKVDEIEARELYSARYGPVEEVAFVVNTELGFPIGYSPDGLSLCGEGQIECKGRRQKYQLQTIIEGGDEERIPEEYIIQVQTGLFVTKRRWCDFISFSGGLPMATIRCYPDPIYQKAIAENAMAFEKRLAEKLATYHSRVNSGGRFIPTERRVEAGDII